MAQALTVPTTLTALATPTGIRWPVSRWPAGC